LSNSEKTAITTIVFDLGGVLIDWNPRYVYRQIFDTAAAMEEFLSTICTNAWNEAQDAGYPLQQATDDLLALHPQWAQEIKAYYGRWEEMLKGPIPETVDVLTQLKDGGRYRLYALTNWSAETFPVALRKYDFLHWFEGIVVSGTEKTRKPFPEIYDILLTRYSITSGEAVFIDDNPHNVTAGKNAGMAGIHFQNAGQLVAGLRELGVEI
jgi:2-haloacid dehalogenase